MDSPDMMRRAILHKMKDNQAEVYPAHGAPMLRCSRELIPSSETPTDALQALQCVKPVLACF